MRAQTHEEQREFEGSFQNTVRLPLEAGSFVSLGLLPVLRDDMWSRSRAKRGEKPAMHLYGYARVSTTDQDLAIQDRTRQAAAPAIGHQTGSPSSSPTS